MSRTDPVAVVSGGSCGAGRDVARMLAARGYAVVVVYLRDQAEAEAVVGEIIAADGAALAVRADVTDELDVERLFSETAAAFGGVDVVVHAALRGSSVVNRHAARRMRHGGAIVSVSTADPITPVLADEFRACNITVNGLVAGLEPPGARREIADLVALLDRWRRAPGSDQGVPGRERRGDAGRCSATSNPRRSSMSSVDVSGGTATPVAELRTIDMKLEVVVLPVSDADRAKQFYASLGWREDADFGSNEDYRVLQFTPTGSHASIIFGVGVTAAAPGSMERILLAVDDIAAAREALRARGVDVSELFHDAGGSLGGGFRPGVEGRAAGPDPEGRSYGTYASFSDPDGNGWLLQEITERLPGRV